MSEKNSGDNRSCLQSLLTENFPLFENPKGSCREGDKHDTAAKQNMNEDEFGVCAIRRDAGEELHRARSRLPDQAALWGDLPESALHLRRGGDWSGVRWQHPAGDWEPNPCC